MFQSLNVRALKFIEHQLQLPFDIIANETNRAEHEIRTYCVKPKTRDVGKYGIREDF